MFSILIPSWNSLTYLKCCILSIQKNSFFTHEIIVHVNDGSDGTLEWLNEMGIVYTHSLENIGICKAMNLAFEKSTKDYIMYMNDDMYCTHHWDKPLYDMIQLLGDELFMLSSTMIEPTDTNNPCVIVKNYGQDILAFKEDLLQLEVATMSFPNWNGSTWPPNVVSRSSWERIKGFSEEFSPGMSSDDDFSMKMWQIGCRYFIGIGDSLVYHFQCKSTGRIVKNNGRKQFVAKWKIYQSAFHHYYIKRGSKYVGKLSEPAFSLGLIIQKIRGRFF